MKKQIFILVLALFASTMSFAQAIKGSDPRPLTCPNDALHPIAGKPYTYTLDATTQAGGVFTWWATKDPSFIATNASGVTTMNTGTALTVASKNLLNTSANYGAANASTTNNVSITWSSALLVGTEYQSTPGAASPAKTPTFVAAHYAAPAASGCADNFKVFELDPLNGFTVDILSLDPTAKTPVGALQAVYTYAAEQCVDKVRGASYVADQILFDYGTNVLYYEIVAANFSEQWTPTFLIGGLQPGQTADIVWDTDNTFATPVSVSTAVGNGEYVSPSAATVDASVTNTSLGVSIYVKVTIHNGKYETIADNTISLAVAGQNKELQWDVDNNVVTADCLTVSAKTFEDSVNQLIKPRPTVVEGTTSTMSTNPNLIDPQP